MTKKKKIGVIAGIAAALAALLGIPELAPVLAGLLDQVI